MMKRRNALITNRLERGRTMSKMRKRTFVALVIALIFALAACAGPAIKRRQ